MHKVQIDLDQDTPTALKYFTHFSTETFLRSY